MCSFNSFSNEECQSCHQQTRDWKQSDHASSMALANKDTVLGDFNDITAPNFYQKDVFIKEKDMTLIHI